MVYKKLLLSEGGGIVSPFQQVDQSNDTANILAPSILLEIN